MKWQYFKLKDLLLLSDSGTWGPESDKYNGSPVLRSTNIQANQLVFDKVAWRKIPFNHQNTKALKSGDIIVTTSSGSPAHIGKTCIFQQPSDKITYYFSNFTLRLRPNPKLIDARLLQYWLTSSHARMFLQTMNNTTSGLRNLNRNMYLKQKIPLPIKPDGTPDIEEQRRIAAILDKADEIRRKRQEAIRLADELLRSTFLEMFGDPVTNPKGWLTERLGNLAKIITGTTPPSKKSGMFGGKIPFITPGDLESRKSASRFVTEEGAKNSRIARKGATLVCCIGTIGKTDMALSQVAFNQQINAVEWNKNIVDEYGFLSLSYGRILVINAAIKTTLPIIKKSLFSNIRIPVPPLDDQRKFAEFFQQQRQYHMRLSFIKKEADNLFNSLVQRAFRGELFEEEDVVSGKEEREKKKIVGEQLSLLKDM